MNQQSVPVVTIDGPSASGKSSVSRELARELGWKWVSTGAFYRGLAYVAEQMGTDISSEQAVVDLAHSNIWGIELHDEHTRVIFRGNDVTDQIYNERVGAFASQISHYPKVRESLLQAQRDCATGVVGLVAEGRDCGTVVFPDADAKIYLTARSESRAERRAREFGESVEETHAAQKQRDAQDSGRQAAPLRVAPNALVVDTSEMDLKQVVEKVLEHVRETLTPGRS